MQLRFIFLLFLFIIPLVSASYIDMNITDDSYGYSPEATGYHNYAYMLVGNYQYPTGYGQLGRGFMKANLTPISTLSYSKIINSTLYFYIDDCNSYLGSCTATTITIYRITASWAESTLTWNNQPSADTTSAGSLSAGTTKDVWKGISINNAILLKMANGTYNNYGFSMKSSELVNRSGRDIDSSEGTYKPYIRVYYDNTAPTITFDYPTSNGQWFNTNATDINFTISDSALSTCKYKLDAGANTTRSCTDDFDTETWGQGTHTIILWANDTYGNSASASRQWYTDSITPTITWGANTLANDSKVAKTYIYFDITASDTNLKNYTYYYASYPTACTSGTSYDSLTADYNKTGLSDGKYNYCARVRDEAGNSNTTAQRTITLDTTDPVITINKPEEINYNNNLSIPVNFTVTDTNLNVCWWKLDSGSDNIIACNTATTFDTSQGFHTFYAYANDTAGNSYTTSHTFEVNLAPPTISVTYPTDDSWLNYRTNLKLNYTPYDSGGVANCSLYSNFSGSWLLNQTDTSINNNVSNTFNISSLQNGVYIWNILCKDTFGHSAWSNPSSNLTLNIDTIYPQITYNSAPTNATQTTATSLFLSINLTESNIYRMRYYLYNSTGSVYDSDIYITAILNNTWSSIVDGLYYYNVTALDRAGNSNTTQTRTITFDDTSPTITINSPIANYSNNDSILINTTITDNLVGVDNCWFSVTNGTGYNYYLTSYNCSTHAISLPSGDVNYTLTIYANDTLNNTAQTNQTFGIRTVAPTITFNFPASTINYSNNVSLNFTATDSDGVSSCKLYHNFNGAWSLNQTVTGIVSSTIKQIGLFNLSEQNGWKWGLICNDSYGNTQSSNQTFNIDLTSPSVTYNSPANASSQSLTFTMTYNISDANINTCTYNIKDLSDDSWEYVPDQSLTCSETGSKSITLSAGNYRIFIWAEDETGKITEATRWVTTVNPTTTTTGGSGSGTTISKSIILEPATNFSLTVGRSSKLDIVLAKDSVKPRTKILTISNNGQTPITVSLSCDTTSLSKNQTSSKIKICDYVTFSNSTVIVSPNEQVQTQAILMLTAPPNATFGDSFDFNVIATRVLSDSETQTVKQFSKLSVSSRLPLWGIIFKWSPAPSLDQPQSFINGTNVNKLVANSKSYPVAPISIFVSFIIFTVIFLTFRKKMALTGFSLGITLFLVSFILLLVLL